MTAPMPFIVGVPRSGTTLVRLMLDAHPLLAIPPGTGFVPALRELRADGRDVALSVRDLWFAPGQDIESLARDRRDRIRRTRALGRRRADGTVLITREERLRNQRLSAGPPDPAEIGRFKRDLSPARRARFESVAGGLLSDLGYEAEFTGVFGGPLRRRRAIRAEAGR